MMQGSAQQDCKNWPGVLVVSPGRAPHSSRMYLFSLLSLSGTLQDHN
jgi:hypothetical protein